MNRIVKYGKNVFKIEDEDDLIFVVHFLTKEGFKPSDIAFLLDITIEKVIECLEDCW